MVVSSPAGSKSGEERRAWRARALSLPPLQERRMGFLISEARFYSVRRVTTRQEDGPRTVLLTDFACQRTVTLGLPRSAGSPPTLFFSPPPPFQDSGGFFAFPAAFESSRAAILPSARRSWLVASPSSVPA